MSYQLFLQYSLDLIAFGLKKMQIQTSAAFRQKDGLNYPAWDSILFHCWYDWIITSWDNI